VSNIFKPDRIMPLGKSLIDPRYQSLWDDLLVLAPIWLGGGARVQNLVDPTNEGTIVDTANTVWRHGRRGRVLEQLVHNPFVPDVDDIDFLPSAEVPTTAATILLHQRKTDTTNRNSGAFGIDTFDVPQATCGAHVPYGNGTVYWDFGGFTGGSSRLSVPGLTFGDDVWVFVVGSRGMEIWQNGTLVGSHGNSVTRTVGSANWGLGHHDVRGNDLVEYSFLALWQRELSHSEIRLASNNPFGMITPDIDDLGFVAAAAIPPIFVRLADVAMSQAALSSIAMSQAKLSNIAGSNPVLTDITMV